jgi:hypothetical protein
MTGANAGNGGPDVPKWGGRAAGSTFRAVLLLGAALVGTAITAVWLQGTDSGRADAGQLPSHKGQFVVECRYSHSAFDDPIVFPGEPGQSHLHDFFGNTTADAFSTTDSLLDGATTCATAQDAASYWAPALFDEDGKIDPGSSDAYYKAAPGVDPADVEPFPVGLRMISGDSMSTEPQPADVVGFSCSRQEVRTAEPRTCAPGAPMTVRVTFPDCWDGRHVDSEDHKSHMAFSDADGCPSSHPRVLPQLEFVIYYGYDGDPGDLRLASGPPATAHADFFNAWEPDKLAREVQYCLNRDVYCAAAIADLEGPQARTTAP